MSGKAKATGNTAVFSRLLTKLDGNKTVKIALFLSDISIKLHLKIKLRLKIQTQKNTNILPTSVLSESG